VLRFGAAIRRGHAPVAAAFAYNGMRLCTHAQRAPMTISIVHLAELLAGIARSQQAIIDAVERADGGWRSTHLIPMLNVAANTRAPDPRLIDLPSRILLRYQGRAAVDSEAIVADLERLFALPPDGGQPDMTAPDAAVPPAAQRFAAKVAAAAAARTAAPAASAPTAAPAAAPAPASPPAASEDNLDFSKPR